MKRREIKQQQQRRRRRLRRRKLALANAAALKLEQTVLLNQELQWLDAFDRINGVIHILTPSVHFQVAVDYAELEARILHNAAQLPVPLLIDIETSPTGRQAKSSLPHRWPVPPGVLRP